MSSRAPLALLPLLVIALAGCGAAGSGSDASSSTDSQEVSADTGAEDAETDQPDGSSQGDVLDEALAFGDTYTWDSGVSLTVDAPEEFTPSASAEGADGDGTPMTYEVTVENGSSETFEPSGIYVLSTSGGAEDESIYDTEKGVEDPSVSVLPGKSLTWTVAFNVNDPADQVIESSDVNDFDAEAVYFTAE